MMYIRSLSLVLFGLFFWIQSCAQTYKPLIDNAAIERWQRASSPSLSIDGKYAGHVVQRLNGSDQQLIIKEVNGKWPLMISMGMSFLRRLKLQ
ncbi:MAG: hypothetical protein V4594_10855 [Bacteroidota bacterium]